MTQGIHIKSSHEALSEALDAQAFAGWLVELDNGRVLAFCHRLCVQWR